LYLLSAFITFADLRIIDMQSSYLIEHLKIKCEANIGIDLNLLIINS
jgi:hypothetical protein